MYHDRGEFTSTHSTCTGTGGAINPIPPYRLLHLAGEQASKFSGSPFKETCMSVQHRWAACIHWGGNKGTGSSSNTDLSVLPFSADALNSFSPLCLSQHLSPPLLRKSLFSSQAPSQEKKRSLSNNDSRGGARCPGTAPLGASASRLCGCAERRCCRGAGAASVAGRALHSMPLVTRWRPGVPTRYLVTRFGSGGYDVANAHCVNNINLILIT